MPAEKLSSAPNPDITPDNTSGRQLGARILSAAGFQDRQKSIVDSSFNRAIERSEKLPGKNAERRNYAYLSRLENLIETNGNALERRLWERSVKKLIVKPENIPDSYWQSQEQILRDGGQGRELNDYEKDELIESIQSQQRESLESWSNYLGNEDSPYPLWFKVYAWDGMSKMGVFNSDKGYFTKRDAGTVAPYPKLNPAALAKTYAAITNVYGIPDSGRPEAEFQNHREVLAPAPESPDETLANLVKTNNFNKIYSKILLSEKSTPRTPENTADVRGEWREYLPGDEEKLATAAEGTPWCIADPGTGRSYLEHGSYIERGQSEDEESHAKFILFHLYDSQKGTLSESACASIRLDTEGYVAEISGLKPEQALEDSLVPIVEAKVKTLPGGENFLEAFADKQALIALDRKMQSGADLTASELEFVYELDRPIFTLEGYAGVDPRIYDLRRQYDYKYALEHGVNVNKLMKAVGHFNVANNLDTFLKHGANLQEIVASFNKYELAEHLDTLMGRGANIDVRKLINDSSNGRSIIVYLPQFLNHAPVDEVLTHLDANDIVDHLDILTEHGANIDIHELLKDKKAHRAVSRNLAFLLDRGATIDEVLPHLTEVDMIEYRDLLLDHGVKINVLDLIRKLSNKETANLEFREYYILEKFSDLLRDVSDPDDLLSELRPRTILGRLDFFLSNGIDINDLMLYLSETEIVKNIDLLQSHGADIDIDVMASLMSDWDLLMNLDTLVSHGADIDIDELTSRLDKPTIAFYLTTLRRHGANIDVDKFVSTIHERDVHQHLATFLENGADLNNLVNNMLPEDVINDLFLLRSYGYQG